METQKIGGIDASKGGNVWNAFIIPQNIRGAGRKVRPRETETVAIPYGPPRYGEKGEEREREASQGNLLEVLLLHHYS